MRSDCKTIVVNSTAAVSGGALTIIKEFIQAIVTERENDEFQFVFFTAVDYDLDSIENVKIINVGEKGYINRVIWDYYGFKSFLKVHSINPDLIMSFQNTGLLYPSSCPQLIYFHNSFCLLPEYWNPFSRAQRIPWFYTNIYPFFIKALINKNTQFIVQANWIKNSFAKRFKVSPKKIAVVRPTVNLFQVKEDLMPNVGDEIILFFPSTAFLYKNHQLLFEMMTCINTKDPLLFKSMKLVLTLSTEDVIALGLKEKYDKVKENVELIGYINKNEMLKYYLLASLVLFPSRIETFGLPLIEAASLNKFILCAEEPYALETLSGYNNVIFTDIDKPHSWALNCIDIIKNKQFNHLDSSIDYSNNDSWRQIFSILKKIIS